MWLWLWDATLCGCPGLPGLGHKIALLGDAQQGYLCKIRTQAENELGTQEQVLQGPNFRYPQNFLVICKLAAVNKGLSGLEVQWYCWLIDEAIFLIKHSPENLNGNRLQITSYRF